MKEEDAMSMRQLREEVMQSAFEPVVYDYGKTGVLCEECGELLTTAVCSRSCPYSLECEDYGIHHVMGQTLCPVLREGDEK